MAKQKRLVAEPVSKIIEMETGRLAGLMYRWNNGDLQEAWLDDRQAQAFYPAPEHEDDGGTVGLPADTALRRRA